MRKSEKENQREKSNSGFFVPVGGGIPQVFLFLHAARRRFFFNQFQPEGGASFCGNLTSHNIS
jgi:hypothetical protein